eukprot:5105767-Pyramimonas_sp.AAC.1
MEASMASRSLRSSAKYCWALSICSPADRTFFWSLSKLRAAASTALNPAIGWSAGGLAAASSGQRAS